VIELLWGHDDDVASFVSETLDRGQYHRPYVGIGVVKPDADGVNATLIGGVLLTDYTGPNIEITFCGKGIMTRKTIREVLSYVFEDLKCHRLTARTRRDNRLMCKLLPRLGFDYEATLKHYFGPERCDDALIFRLTPEYASRWI
jgi:RimJ/RimL family protein N-acetyltransferase